MSAPRALSTQSDGHPLLDYKARALVGKSPIRRRRFAAFVRNIGLKGLLFSLRGWQSHHAEPRKVAIDGDRLTAVSRCWVHFVPVCGTVVLAYLNLSGFYIGYNLEGWHGSNADSLKMLIFQAVAKLFELLVAASVATIILDIVRHELMASQGGVPLGLLFSHVNFSSLSFFVSPEFLSGSRGFRSRRKTAIVMVGLLICGIIALLVGPGSALLLIPAQRTSWPAGGADFWLAGNSSSLWPERMSAASISAKCANPDEPLILAQRMDFSGCAWSGYQSLLADYRATHRKSSRYLTLTDGVVNRRLLRFFGAESAAVAPCVACASFSSYIAGEWILAIKGLRGVSSAAHYQRFGYTPPVIAVTGFVPIVRTRCEMKRSNDTSDRVWRYPYFPPNGPWKSVWYEMPARPLLNSTAIAMQWRDIPSGATQLSNGSSTDYYPSAFLDFQVPWGGNLSAPGSYFYTCSIDARWAKIDTMGAEYDDVDVTKYNTFANPETLTWPNAEEALPANRAIAMSSEWLQNLIPPLSDVTQPGWTTLTSIMTAEFLDSINTDQLPLQSHTASIIATVFTDGLSRHGYEENGGDIGIADFHPQVWQRYTLPSDLHDKIYKSEAVIPAPVGWTEANSTKVHWSLTISGYSYKADDVSYRLSLALLFVHAFLAIGHTFWVIRRGTSSEAWGSTAELLVLAQNSPPEPDGLKNTCAGIETGETLRRCATIRVAEPNTAGKSTGCEQVQLVFGVETALRGKRVEVDVAYGENMLHQNAGDFPN